MEQIDRQIAVYQENLVGGPPHHPYEISYFSFTIISLLFSYTLFTLFTMRFSCVIYTLFLAKQKQI